MAPTEVGIRLLEQVFAMSKGDDENSYTKNSDVPKALVDKHGIPRLDEVLHHVTLPPPGQAIVVADLGCASAPNAIRHAAHIVKSLRSRSPDAGEVQVFFNDLPSNDFNTFFQLWSREIRDDFFAAGVPGSFCGRLFPRSTVHVFFSSMGLHYLSKIPDEIYDKTSPAHNAENLHVDDAPAAVGDCYKKQAATDLRNFLQARAAELAPGGLVFIFAKGSGFSGKGPRRAFVEDDAIDILFICMMSTWKTLESKGLLTKEQTGAFNFPIYFRSLDELNEGIDSCSSKFRALRMETVKGKLFCDAYNVDLDNVDRVAFCKAVTGFSRGVMGGYMEGIVGSKTAEYVWDEFSRTLARTAVPQLLGFSTFCIVVLVRK